MKRVFIIAGIAAVAAFGMVACNKENQNAYMTVRMKDAPIDFDSVNVEILQVQAHYSSGNAGWVDLATNAGIYNLLDLQNGVTAALVNNNQIPVGDIQQMRLILGTNNWAVINDSLLGQFSVPLELSSQDKTGLKVNLNSSVSPGDSVEILLDFDAQESIVVQGNNTYRLKPVVKLESIVYF